MKSQKLILRLTGLAMVAAVVGVIMAGTAGADQARNPVAQANFNPDEMICLGTNTATDPTAGPVACTAGPGENTALGASVGFTAVHGLAGGDKASAAPQQFFGQGWQMATDAAIADGTEVGGRTLFYDYTCDGDMDMAVDTTNVASPYLTFAGAIPEQMVKRTINWTSSTGFNNDNELWISGALPNPSLWNKILRFRSDVDAIWMDQGAGVTYKWAIPGKPTPQNFVIGHPVWSAAGTIVSNYYNGTVQVLFPPRSVAPSPALGCVQNPFYEKWTADGSVLKNPASVGDWGSPGESAACVGVGGEGCNPDGIDDASGVYVVWTYLASTPDISDKSQNVVVTHRGITIGTGAHTDADGDGVESCTTAQPGRPCESPADDAGTAVVCAAGSVMGASTTADGDCDGLVDGVEINWGTDPAVADTDGDGLRDMEEMVNGTVPTDDDTDNDGVLDGGVVLKNGSGTHSGTVTNVSIPKDEIDAAASGQSLRVGDNCPVNWNDSQANSDGWRPVDARAAKSPGPTTVVSSTVGWAGTLAMDYEASAGFPAGSTSIGVWLQRVPIRVGTTLSPAVPAVFAGTTPAGSEQVFISRLDEISGTDRPMDYTVTLSGGTALAHSAGTALYPGVLLTSAATAGSTTSVTVAFDILGYLGQTSGDIHLGFRSPNSEMVHVDSVSGNTYTLSAPVEFDHVVGELVGPQVTSTVTVDVDILGTVSAAAPQKVLFSAADKNFEVLKVVGKAASGDDMVYTIDGMAEAYHQPGAKVMQPTDRTFASQDYEGDACDDDDDGDGIQDFTEMLLTFTSTPGVSCAYEPNQPSVYTIPGIQDFDGDRFVDGEECRWGTIPNSSSSVPAKSDGGDNDYMAYNSGAYYGISPANYETFFRTTEIRYSPPSDPYPTPDAGWTKTTGNPPSGSQLCDLDNSAGDAAGKECGEWDTDSDGDSLNDGYEALVFRTSPSSVDTDRDGCSDTVEVKDLSGDAKVSSADISQLLGSWLCTSTTPCYDPNKDLSVSDKKISSADISQLLGSWLVACGSYGISQ